MTKKQIEKMVEKITGAKKGDEEFLAGCILGASMIVGPYIKKICQFLDIKQTKQVTKISNNYRKNGIWTQNKVIDGGWFKKKTGGVALNCDIAVGCGWLKRTTKPKK